MKLCSSSPVFQWKENETCFRDGKATAIHRKKNVRLVHISWGTGGKAARFVACETERLRNVSYGTVPTAEKVTSDSCTIYEVIWPYKVSLLTSLHQCVTRVWAVMSLQQRAWILIFKVAWLTYVPPAAIYTDSATFTMYLYITHNCLN